MPERFIVISGCSGGGKSTLLDALAARGFATVPEPGRRIVTDALAGDGSALPWVNPKAFALRAVAMAKADLHAAQSYEGTVFFDRGLIDAACALAQTGGAPLDETLGQARAYGRAVFLTPPWPEIYQKDDARQHDFRVAEAEFQRLVQLYPKLGYDIHLLPKRPVQDRVAFVLGILETDGPRKDAPKA